MQGERLTVKQATNSHESKYVRSMHDLSTRQTSLSAWSTIKLPADVQMRLPMHLIYFRTWIKLTPCLTCVRQIEACNVIHCKGVWHLISYHICRKLLLVCTTSKLCIVDFRCHSPLRSPGEDRRGSLIATSSPRPKLNVSGFWIWIWIFIVCSVCVSYVHTYSRSTEYNCPIPDPGAVVNCTALYCAALQGWMTTTTMESWRKFPAWRWRGMRNTRWLVFTE